MNYSQNDRTENSTFSLHIRTPLFILAKFGACKLILDAFDASLQTTLEIQIHVLLIYMYYFEIFRFNLSVCCYV